MLNNLSAYVIMVENYYLKLVVLNKIAKAHVNVFLIKEM